MQKSKLLTILEQFSKYEQNRFHKYITSPYFNRNEELINLYTVFTDRINRGEDLGDYAKEDAWQAIRPGDPFDDVRFRKYLSDLLKLAEGFLVQEELGQNPVLRTNLLMEAAKRNKYEALFPSLIRSGKKISSDQPFQNTSYYYHLYQLEKNYYELTDFETRREDISNIEEISSNLDYFFLGEKLRILCEVLSRRKFVSYDYKLSFIEEIINHLASNEYDIAPIAIYYQIYLLYTDSENEDHYYKLRELLDQHSHKFPVNEAREELYMAAQNYCISKINEGNQSFLKELFSLYKSLLKKGIITVDGKIPEWYFRNIASTGLRVREFEWTENFIKTYQDYLPESSRENVVTYNLAQLYLYQKRYSDVIEQLQNVEYENVMYNLNSKSMLLATYYEIDEIEPLYSLIESFRSYLNRRKDIPEERRKLYNNLIRFTKKLTKLAPGDKASLSKIKNEIIATKNVASINWLLEKIAELEGV